jgi:hypothetical protein
LPRSCRSAAAKEGQGRDVNERQAELFLPARDTDLILAERDVQAARARGNEAAVADLAELVADFNDADDPLERARLISAIRRARETIRGVAPR